MKKLLLMAVLLLSGCASDLTKYPRYDVAVPEAKARLYIAKPDNYLDEWHSEMLNFREVRQAWQKYFVKADEHSADFILKLTHWKDKSGGWETAWATLSILSAGIIPSWPLNKQSYSFSLMQRETGKTFFLSDVNTTSRLLGGWLLLPMLFSSDVYFMDDYASYRAVANAIEDAASLVYDKNSKIYQTTTQKKWGVPSVSPAVEKAPASVPVKEPNPEEMDMLW